MATEIDDIDIAIIKSINISATLEIHALSLLVLIRRIADCSFGCVPTFSGYGVVFMYIYDIQEEIGNNLIPFQTKHNNMIPLEKTR